MSDKWIYVCECMKEDCNEYVPTDEFLELKQQAHKCSSTGYISLKGHYDPEIHRIIAETENLVLSEYTDGRYEVYDE